MTGTAAAEVDPQNGAGQTDAVAGTDRPRYDDINTSVLLIVGLLSAIVTLCTFFFLQGLYYQWSNAYLLERTYDYVNEPVRQIVEGQKSLLNGDADKGIKPIAETIPDIVKQFGKSN